MASSAHLQIQQLQAKLKVLESTQRESDEEHARILAKQRQQAEDLQAQNAHLRQLLGKGSKVRESWHTARAVSRPTASGTACSADCSASSAECRHACALCALRRA